MYPSDRYYSKQHEWIRVEGESGTIGITQFAQDQLGDIVFVELPEVGLTLARGDVLGTIESVKAVSEIYSPVSGTVSEVNQALEAKPETVNSDPHGDGWFCKLTLTEPPDPEQAMDAEAYAQFVESAES